MYRRLAFLGLVAAAVVAGAMPEVAQAKTGGPVNGADTAWMLAATALVLLMTPGLSFFYGGMVRLKNVVSTLLQSFIAMAVVTLLWYFVGFSLAFGTSLHGVIGDPRTFLLFRGVGLQTHPELAVSIPLLLFALFQLKFAIIAPALITGAFAERVRFKAYVLFIALFTLFIYAPLAHWTWHPEGFLHKWGVLDFAGGTVVHMSAGFAALAGAMLLGRRKLGHHEEKHSPANLPFVMLGTGLLWFGWFGFNAGSALSASGTAVLAFATTNTAAAAAMIGWLAFDWVRGRKPSALGACTGAVVGLVAITPACGFVTVGQSLLIGLVASGISNAALQLKHKTAVDDTLDVFACHGLGGTVGMVLTAVFAKDVGLIYGHLHTFLVHLAALAVVAGFSFGGAWVLYRLVDWIVPLRVSAEHEVMGLDLSQHGETIGAFNVSPLEPERRDVGGAPVDGVAAPAPA